MARATLLSEMAMQHLLIFQKHAHLTQFFAESVEVAVLEVVLEEEEELEVVFLAATVALEGLHLATEELQEFLVLQSTSY